MNTRTKIEKILWKLLTRNAVIDKEEVDGTIDQLENLIKEENQKILKGIIKMSKQYKDDFGTFDYEGFGMGVLKWAEYFTRKP